MSDDFVITGIAGPTDHLDLRDPRPGSEFKLVTEHTVSVQLSATAKYAVHVRQSTTRTTDGRFDGGGGGGGRCICVCDRKTDAEMIARLISDHGAGRLA